MLPLATLWHLSSIKGTLHNLCIGHFRNRSSTRVASKLLVIKKFFKRARRKEVDGVGWRQQTKAHSVACIKPGLT